MKSHTHKIDYMNTSKTYVILFISIIVFLSCHSSQKDGDNHFNIENAISDSIQLEKYYEWRQNIETIDLDEDDKYILVDLETDKDSLKILDFLKDNLTMVEFYTNQFSYTPDELFKYTYHIDFNGDGLMDIVYHGPTGGEPSVTHFILNHGNKYEKVFSGLQNLIDVEFFENRLIAFTLIDPGCCGDPQYFISEYSVQYNEDIPEFKLDRKVGYLRGTEKSKIEFKKTEDFTVISDFAKLRKDCYIFDDVEDPVTGSNGNAIGIYRKRAKGKVLGLKRDQNKLWLNVLMNTGNKLDSTVFPEFTDPQVEVLGWMIQSDTDWR